MMRIFTAIPAERSKALTDFVGSLKKIAPYPQVKWVDPAQYHITLQFMGDIEQTQLPAIFSSLEKVAAQTSPFGFTITSPGIFKDRKNFIRVIWAGIEPASPFFKLHELIKSSLSNAGFSINQSSFKAHLTLGRAKQAITNQQALENHINTYTPFVFSSQQAAYFQLIQSKLTSGGAIYKTLKTFNLTP
ncbi:MAG: RNA 2',3'-cyclic phosphodiesterase [Bacteroidales bacterium]